MIAKATIWRVAHKVKAVRAHGIGDISDTVETVVLKLEDKDGATGWGEAAPWAPFAGTSEAAAAALSRYLAPAYMGEPAASLPAIMAKADKLLAGHWDAKAALESALLDLEARRRGVPVWALLGGKGRDRIPLSISIADPEWARDADLIQRTFEAGIRRFKLKTGFASHAFDLQRVEAIRDAFGDEVHIAVDYNQGLTPREAMTQVPDMDSLGLSFIEQPVRREQPEAMIALTAATKTPLLADESVFTLGELTRAAQQNLANGLSIKVMKCGGPRRGLAIAEAAAALGWEAWGGDMFESGLSHLAGVHMIAAAPGFEWGCEYYHANWHVEADLLTTRFPEENGEIVVPDGPGLGIEADEARIKAQATEVKEIIT